MTVPNDTAVGRSLESASVEFIDKKKEMTRASACEGEFARTRNEAAKDAALGKTMTAALVSDVTTY